MLSNILQKLTIFFRNSYISSLKPFIIKTNPKELKKETRLNLPEKLRDNLDVYVKVYANFIKKTERKQQQWNDMAEETGVESKGLKNIAYRSLAHEPAKRQMRTYEKVIKRMDSNTKLYLVGFNKNLTCREAKFELSKIGFKPVDALEMVLFFQKYKETIKHHLPIIALEAYLDADKKIGIILDDLYSLCLYSHPDGMQFNEIGEIESSELYEDAKFMKNTLFLIKPI